MAWLFDTSTLFFIYSMSQSSKRSLMFRRHRCRRKHETFLPYYICLTGKVYGEIGRHVYHLQRVTDKKMYKQDSLYEMLLISLYFKGTALCWGPTWISQNFATDRCQRELRAKRSSLEGSNRSSSSSKDSRFGLSVAKSVSFTLFETFSRFCLMCENEKK